MKALGDLIFKRKQKTKISFSDKDIFFVFGKVIKEEFGNLGAGNLQADFFKGKTIFVKSGSSVWGGELWNNRSRIIRKINKELGEGTVENLKVR